MAILSGKRSYALGRECVIEVDGQAVSGAADVLVRESTTEIDATPFNAEAASTLVVLRTFEIQVSVPDLKQAQRLYKLRDTKKGDFVVPRVVDVTLQGGLIEFTNEPFVIADVQADEPLDGVVVPRFTMKQWKQ